MTGNWVMSIPYPIADGSAGHTVWRSSARPSVTDLECEISTPVAATSQGFIRSGFYAESTHAVSDVLSTPCEFRRIPKIIPTRRVNCFTVCAESSLCSAPVTFDTETFSSQSPLAPGNGRLFSR